MRSSRNSLSRTFSSKVAAPCSKKSLASMLCRKRVRVFSMHLAALISCAAISSGISPICIRYIRTGSSMQDGPPSRRGRRHAVFFVVDGGLCCRRRQLLASISSSASSKASNRPARIDRETGRRSDDGHQPASHGPWPPWHAGWRHCWLRLIGRLWCGAKVWPSCDSSKDRACCVGCERSSFGRRTP